MTDDYPAENPIPENNPAPNTSGEPDEKTNAPKPEVAQEKNWWDKIKAFVEMLGVVLLAIYTGYTIKMYHANKQAADAAIRAAKSAEDSITQARDSAHLDQQVWLGQTEALKHLLHNSPNTVSVYTLGKDGSPRLKYFLRTPGRPQLRILTNGSASEPFLHLSRSPQSIQLSQTESVLSSLDRSLHGPVRQPKKQRVSKSKPIEVALTSSFFSAA